MAPLTRSRYTPAELHQAIQDVISGQSGRFVSGKSKIPYLTLMRKVRETKAGTLVPPQRRGPPPILPRDCESDLVAWITAMQQDGHPVDRHMILIKGNQLVRQLDPLGSVSGGWYKRFMQRHTQLTSRSAQVISHARNSVNDAAVQVLFDSVESIIAEHGIITSEFLELILYS
ncbi:hypothetical protein DYB28_013992 [Aphanomyces astaci]|uniref:HTH CENPB-type domain-containing protein n=1 Tax=Aphanomyces astaci TaxID=112090 RepID=A0A9X8DRI6_APHAT|nr:hypothetical protein DYB28_008802 [Aphanomyces astaci]RLO02354.1 hypothetical protein DYB28_000640 [Aphanomyces astaci]RLO12370.1 hypothetical protein DYB28_013992 [Aphanomyces astaci]